jgi:hypothetical protein
MHHRYIKKAPDWLLGLEKIWGYLLSNIILNEVFIKGLPPEWPSGKRLVFMHLVERYNDISGKSYPGEEELIRFTGLARGTIYDYIKELKEEGYVSRLKRGCPGQRAEYKVHFPSLKGNYQVGGTGPIQRVESSADPKRYIQEARMLLADNRLKSAPADPKHTNIQT